MKSFESVIAWLYPVILLKGTPWAAEWQAKERAVFISTARVFLPIIGAGWLLHFYFFDKPMGLEPLEHWFALRMINAGLCAFGFVFYLTKVARTVRWYRLPAIAIATVFSASQGVVTNWYGHEAWIFCFILVIAAVMLVRMTVLGSLIFAIALISIQAVVLTQSGLHISNTISGTLVTLILIALMRSSQLAEVQNFLLNQENIAAQAKISEMSVEFSARIRAFIPKVIADRLQYNIENQGRTILAASLEVLEPRKCEVACLFSDIRGFTQGSKDLDKFISHSVVPEMKISSNAIERHRGIPRKVGDLLFAYFDDDYVRLNLLRAVASGFDIARLNSDMNATSAEVSIRRYILISVGEAIVGNIGGLDSSVEITALGPPVNFLSRLDELTKDPSLSPLLEPADLIICKRSAELLNEMDLRLDLIPIELAGCGLEIRDFPGAEMIYILRPTDENYQKLLEPYNYIQEREKGRGAIANGGGRVAAY